MSIQFCSFWCNNKLYGINIMHIREIIKPLEITPVFHAAKFVKGLVNVRGEIQLIIDLTSIFIGDYSPLEDEERIILFKNTVGENFGILVQKIDDIIAVQEDFIDVYKGNESSDICSGIYKVGDQLMVIIDPYLILDCEEA